MGGKRPLELEALSELVTPPVKGPEETRQRAVQHPQNWAERGGTCWTGGPYLQGLLCARSGPTAAAQPTPRPAR